MIREPLKIRGRIAGDRSELGQWFAIGLFFREDVRDLKPSDDALIL
jgi:hypothetical protein